MEPLSYGEALKIIGMLSKPGKMPWWGWSTSAFDCQTGSKLREVEGSVCASCYATKGNYSYANVKVAHKRRLEKMKHAGFVDAFVVVLENAMRWTSKSYLHNGVIRKENRFRWFDSGDLQGVEDFLKIVEIAKRTPFVDHWLPTKEGRYVQKALKKGCLIPQNLTVRISNPMTGVKFKSPPMNLPTSTVDVYDDSVVQCSAYSQGGKCLNCRACWNKDVPVVNYPLH